MQNQKIDRVRIQHITVSDSVEGYFDLLGRPLFSSVEDARSFEDLLAECKRVLRPNDLLSALRTKELAEKLFEEQRLKHDQVALVQSALVQSLAMLLRPKYYENIEDALQTASDYIHGNLTQKRAAEKIVNELRITSVQIEANAMYIRSTGLQMMERMVANRQSSRNRILRDHQRNVKKDEKRKRKAAKKTGDSI